MGVVPPASAIEHFLWARTAELMVLATASASAKLSADCDAKTRISAITPSPRVRQQLIRESGLAARAEALIERGAEHMRRHTFVNRGGKRPPPFSGICDAARELLQVRIVGERLGRQVQQPGRDDAAVPPDLGNRRK